MPGQPLGNRFSAAPHVHSTAGLKFYPSNDMHKQAHCTKAMGFAI
jgi:hypothetical protein